MTMINKLILISETEAVDDIGQTITEETRSTIIAQVTSVTGTEFSEGRQSGLDPAFVFVASRFAYSGQKKCEFEGEKLVINRTYLRDENVIELHAGREVGTTSG